ncbi:unnamed protein product, partial [marine sediment metagenome]
LFSGCSTGAGDGPKSDLGTDTTWDDFSEGSKINPGQSRDQDLSDIYHQTAGMAGLFIAEGSVTGDWNTGFGTSLEGGEDLLGGLSTSTAIPSKTLLHSLLLDVSALTDGAIIHVKLFMNINGNERKVYDQEFTVPTTTGVETPPPDTLGLWIVNGTVALHADLRVEVYNNTPADDGKAIGYTYVTGAIHA